MDKQVGQTTAALLPAGREEPTTRRQHAAFGFLAAGRPAAEHVKAADGPAALDGNSLPECRICKEGPDADGAAGAQEWGRTPAGGALLVRPCACGGSMGLVHVSCLQHWIECRRLEACDSDAALTCEVCRTVYRLEFREEMDLSWPRLCSGTALAYYSECLTITLTLGSMAFFFAMCSQKETSSEDGEPRVGLWLPSLIVVLILCMGVFTLCKVVARWRRAMSVPLIYVPQAYDPPV